MRLSRLETSEIPLEDVGITQNRNVRLSQCVPAANTYSQVAITAQPLKIMRATGHRWEAVVAMIPYQQRDEVELQMSRAAALWCVSYTPENKLTVQGEALLHFGLSV